MIWLNRWSSILVYTYGIWSVDGVYTGVVTEWLWSVHSKLECTLRQGKVAFVRGIHRWPVDSPQKWTVTRKMFPFDGVIMPFRVAWVSNGSRWNQVQHYYTLSQQTHGVIITSLLRQSDVASSRWSNDNVIIASCVRWGFLCFLKIYRRYHCIIYMSLSGEPDYFGRNEISSGGDLSPYSSASLY